jgi:transketolase
MRREFAKVMGELIELDKNVFVLSADNGFGLVNYLQKISPKQCINTGLREQATIGMAAGMAQEGLKPYIHAITPFGLDRVFEQIKLDVVQQNTDVKIVTYWDYPEGGPTHLTENPRGLCDILGIRFFAPTDSNQTRDLLMETYSDDQPAFFYLTRDLNLK